jgi:hypothetical protein
MQTIKEFFSVSGFKLDPEDFRQNRKIDLPTASSFVNMPKYMVISSVEPHYHGTIRFKARLYSEYSKGQLMNGNYITANGELWLEQ